MSFGTTVYVDQGHARNTFQAVLNDVFNKIAIGMNFALVAFVSGQGEPGDRPVFATRSIQGRLIGFIRVIANPVQTVRDQ